LITNGSSTLATIVAENGDNSENGVTSVDKALGDDVGSVIYLVLTTK